MIDNSNRKHPNYMKNYLKEWKSRNKERQRHYREIWNKKHPNYRSEWLKNHPNYMKDYLKEWRRNMKRINAGVTLKTNVDLAVASRSDNSIYREIDQKRRKELASQQDGM